MMNIEDKNSTSGATPKRVEGIFYRQGREGFKNGRKGEISLK
jgi:hypothetical protein